MNEKFVTMAVLKAKEGKRAILLTELIKLIDPTRNEAGCLEYVLFEDESHHGTFYMREAFLDRAAFHYHSRTPHFIAFALNMEELLEEPVTLIELKQVSH